MLATHALRAPRQWRLFRPDMLRGGARKPGIAAPRAHSALDPQRQPITPACIPSAGRAAGWRERRRSPRPGPARILHGARRPCQPLPPEARRRPRGPGEARPAAAPAAAAAATGSSQPRFLPELLWATNVTSFEPPLLFTEHLLWTTSALRVLPLFCAANLLVAIQPVPPARHHPRHHHRHRQLHTHQPALVPALGRRADRLQPPPPPPLQQQQPYAQLAAPTAARRLLNAVRRRAGACVRRVYRVAFDAGSCSEPRAEDGVPRVCRWFAFVAASRAPAAGRAPRRPCGRSAGAGPSDAAVRYGPCCPGALLVGPPSP